MKNNFVAKNLYKTNKASIEADKKRLKQSDATLRDAREEAHSELAESQFDSESGTIVGICWDELSEMDWDACERVMNCVGCSSISIEDEEDGK